MTDLDTELRELLQRKASQAGPTPAGAPTKVLRRARRRQGLVAAVAALTVVTVAAGAFAAGRWIGRSEGIPGAPTTSETVEGVTIAYPEDWFLVTQSDVPGPVDPSDGLLFDLSNSQLTQGLMACPPEADDYQRIVAMSVQESLGGSGDAPARPPWPVEPVPFEPDPISSGPMCQPEGWSYLSAEWTAAGRTFFAALAFGADASEADREALMTAYRSMTFEPTEGGTESVELVSGSTGNEAWSLSVRVGANGQPEFTITRENFVTGESSGEGTSAPEPNDHPITALLTTFGEGAKVVTLVYGEVTTDAADVQVSLTGEDAQGNPTERGPEPAEIVDLPEAFGDVNAWYFIAGDPYTGGFTLATDADGNTIEGSMVGFGEGFTETPTGDPGAPPVTPVVYTEHELLWGAYLWTGDVEADARFVDETVAWLQDRDLSFREGDISCDQPTGDETIGDPGDDSLVAVYFTSEAEAHAFVDWYLEERFPGADPVPIQVVEIGTYCAGASQEPPPVEQVALEHGGTVWALYLLTWNGATGVPDEVNDIAGWLESRGVTAAVGSVECDEGSADIVLEPDHDSAVALYLATEQDAHAFLEWYYDTRYPGADHEVLIGQVQTFCLD
jgi:hypothetical protein